MSASAVSRMCVVVMAVLTSPELKTHRPYKAPGRRPRNTLPDPPDHANAGLQKDLVPFRPRCPAVPNQTPAPRGKENAEAPAAPYFRIPERRQSSDVGDKTPAGRAGESAASPRGAFASCPRPGRSRRRRFSTEAVQTLARGNVPCVTPLGEEVASTS